MKEERGKSRRRGINETLIWARISPSFSGYLHIINTEILCVFLVVCICQWMCIYAQMCRSVYVHTWTCVGMHVSVFNQSRYHKVRKQDSCVNLQYLPTLSLLPLGTFMWKYCTWVPSRLITRSPRNWAGVNQNGFRGGSFSWNSACILQDKVPIYTSMAFITLFS